MGAKLGYETTSTKLIETLISSGFKHSSFHLIMIENGHGSSRSRELL